MPGAARREIVAQGEVGVYHCMARCVRRAYLCGKDAVTGKDFDHRKDWVRQGMERLAGAFAIDVASFAIMDNHLHVILRQRPDIAKEWTAQDVTRRWRTIFGKTRKTKQDRERLDVLVEVESADAKMVKERRARLASISWFMRCLCEPIARRANKEDDCKGRFWEGRFRSQALLDDAAILACSAYVDLNPVRAKVAKTPETSWNTSIFERIAEQQRPAKRPDHARDGWLSPMEGQSRKRTPSDRRASNQEVIAMSLDDYLKLLDWTGRQIRQDKRGAMPAELFPILDRLQVRPDRWVECVTNFGRWFKHAAGSPAELSRFARATKRGWFQGLTHSRAAFG